MTDYFILYRSGNTHLKSFSEEEQQSISREWRAWVAALGSALLGNSPILKGGTVLIDDQSVPLKVDETMVNGYIQLQADSLDEVITMCRACPLYKVGKVFEIRELPRD